MSKEIDCDTMCKWLDVQHAAAMDKIMEIKDGEENNVERSEAATDMRIINAIKVCVQTFHFHGKREGEKR